MNRVSWFEALFLGLVQGLAEFLPISSDGHLAIAQKGFDYGSGREGSGSENFFIAVMLHLGTLAAVLIYYRAVARTGLRGLLGAQTVPPPFRRDAVVRTCLLAAVATLPAIPVGLFLKSTLEQAFQSLSATGWGFLATAGVLLYTSRLPGGDKGPSSTTWLDALLIGAAQAFAPLPGVSRSGLTIAAALSLGFSRSWAVGFSLLMSIPAILGGVVLELKDLSPESLTLDAAGPLVAGMLVSGFVGYGAIIWLVRIVRNGRLWYFSVYLIVLAATILALASREGKRADASRAVALDRSSRSGPEGPGDPRTARGPVGSVGRRNPALSPPGCSTAKSATGMDQKSAGPVLG